MVGAAGDCPSVNVFLSLSLSNMCTVATEDNRSEEVIQAVLLVSVTEWKREKERKKMCKRILSLLEHKVYLM